VNDTLGPEDSPVQSECRAQVNVTQTHAQLQPAYDTMLFDYHVDVTTDIKECAVVGFRVYTHTPRSNGSMMIEGGDPQTVSVLGGTERIEGSLQVHTARSRVFWVTDYVSCLQCETATKRNFPKEQTTGKSVDSDEQHNRETSRASVSENRNDLEQGTDEPEEDSTTPSLSETITYPGDSSPTVSSEGVGATTTSADGYSWLELFGAVVQGLADGFANVANQEAYRQALQNEIKRRKSQSTNYQTVPSLISYPYSSPPATAQPPLNQHGNSNCSPDSTSCY
jgi:hypothetical protein